MYPKEDKSGYYKDTCTSMFIAAIFTIANLCKYPRHPTTDEWIKELWYLYIREYYSVIKNKIMLFAGKWMELKEMMLSAVGLVQKDKCSMFSL
jgi:hypothetical protein